MEDIPRVSLSTEDGRSVDLHDDSHLVSPDTHPQLLPPIPFPTESFSESLESITGAGRRVSRALSTTSRASRRMSYMTELRSKRDRSDTASLMTVDEITAEVENRRRTTMNDRHQDDTDDWTEVDSAEGEDGHGEQVPVDDIEEDDFSDEEEEDEDIVSDDEDNTLNDDADEAEENGGPVERKGRSFHWIQFASCLHPGS